MQQNKISNKEKNTKKTKQTKIMLMLCFALGIGCGGFVLTGVLAATNSTVSVGYKTQLSKSVLRSEGEMAVITTSKNGRPVRGSNVTYALQFGHPDVEVVDNVIKLTSDVVADGGIQLQLITSVSGKEVNVIPFELLPVPPVDIDHARIISSDPDLSGADIPLESIAGWSKTFTYNGKIYDKSTITSVKLSPQQINLKSMAFANCSNLKSVDLNNVTSMGQFAFSGCDAITSISISPANSAYKLIDTTIGSQTNWTPVAHTNNGYLINASDMSNGVISSTTGGIGGLAVGDVHFPSNIQKIEPYAFYGASMTALDLNDITDLEAAAFAHCNSIRTLTIDTINTTYGLIDSDIINEYVTSTENGYLVKKASSTSIIPTTGEYGGVACGNVKFRGDNLTIAKYAFVGTSSITKLDLSNVINIGTYAFFDGFSLTSIDLGVRESEPTTWESGCFFNLNSFGNVEVQGAWAKDIPAVKQFLYSQQGVGLPSTWTVNNK